MSPPPLQRALLGASPGGAPWTAGSASRASGRIWRAGGTPCGLDQLRGIFFNNGYMNVKLIMNYTVNAGNRIDRL